MNPWTARMALLLLFFVSLFNYLDRYVLSVLLPSIKQEFQLTDTNLALLTSFFTVTYVLFGIPFARAADTLNRKNVICFALTIWSAMTAACGAVGNFIQLAIARVLVGVGEAGATPPAHSMISDYFPRHQRAKAIAVFSLGAPIGLVISGLLVGAVVDDWGWRKVFFALGVPGLILAIVVYFFLKEPKRGQTEVATKAAEADDKPNLTEVLVALATSPAYVHFCVATGLYTVLWIGIAGWVPSFFVRSFDVSMVQAGQWFALGVGLPQIAGMFLSGFLADFLTRKDVRWYSWIPGIAMLVSTPFYYFVFQTDNPNIAVAALGVGFMIGVLQGPASFAAIQNITHIRMRAMASAMFLMIVNFIGGFLGPVIIGYMSDRLRPSYGDDSLQIALLWSAFLFGFWAALHYFLSARTIRQELQTATSQ